VLIAGSRSREYKAGKGVETRREKKAMKKGGRRLVRMALKAMVYHA
jgi:hypothetical protein